MIDILTASIGIGLAVSLLFSEMFGLAAGGMVVPGYIALYLNRPVDIMLTIVAALLTYFVVHSLSTFIIIYGKRRTVLMIIIGYLVRGLFDADSVLRVRSAVQAQRDVRRRRRRSSRSSGTSFPG